MVMEQVVGRVYRYYLQLSYIIWCTIAIIVVVVLIFGIFYNCMFIAEGIHKPSQVERKIPQVHRKIEERVGLRVDALKFVVA